MFIPSLQDAFELAFAFGHADQDRDTELARSGGDGLQDHQLREIEMTQGQSAGDQVLAELRVAWRRGLEDALAKLPDEIAPYHLLPAAYDAVSEVVRQWSHTFQRSSSASAS